MKRRLGLDGLFWAGINNSFNPMAKGFLKPSSLAGFLQTKHVE